MIHNRMVSWWISWRDLEWPAPDVQGSIRERADQMAAAAVNCAVVFGAHFRWDYLPYWTILHDYLAAVAEELHARGIKLYDHHSAVLVHRYDTAEEMRNVMLHSGPHLPFSPSRTAAADWKFGGQYLNDWRMRDVCTGEILWLPQYTAEQFCHNHPGFLEAYPEYVKMLIAETGIDGLMCDDAAHFMGYQSCGCRHCREKFGAELPPANDVSFWGNWENPAWHRWIAMRYDSNGSFLEWVRKHLPPGFPLMSCCSGSSKAFYNNSAVDVRQYLRGCNLVHQELCGNIPPYPADPGTLNPTIGERLAGAAHHRGAARANHLECIGQGYGFTEAGAGIIWALNKASGAGCWFSTLKARLGLPGKILQTLPDDATPAGKFYRFEAEHPELFDTEAVSSFAVLFPYTARNRSCFGNRVNGCERDFRESLELFFQSGLAPEVALAVPEDAKEYPLLLLPSAARLEEEEVAALNRYADSGGIVLATGYFGYPGGSGLPENAAGREFWSMKWMNDPVPPVEAASDWRELRPGIFWNPRRLQDGLSAEELLGRIRPHLRPLPFRVEPPRGYYLQIRRSRQGYVLHFLAGEYEVKIDEALDAQRLHRSRVNLITEAAPKNCGTTLRIETEMALSAFSPLTTGSLPGESGLLRFPADCAYLIINLSERNQA